MCSVCAYSLKPNPSNEQLNLNLVLDAASTLYICTFKHLNCTNPDLSNPAVGNLNQWFTESVHLYNCVSGCTAVQLHCSPVSVHLYCKQIIYFWVD